MKAFLFGHTLNSITLPLYDTFEDLKEELDNMQGIEEGKTVIEPDRIKAVLIGIEDVRDYLSDLEKLLKWYYYTL